MTLDQQSPVRRPIQKRPSWSAIAAFGLLWFLAQHNLGYVAPDSLSAVGLDGGGGNVRRQITITILGFLGGLLFVSARGWRMRWYAPLFLATASFAGWLALSIGWSPQSALAFRRFLILIFLFIAAYGLNARWQREALLPFIVFASAVQLAAGAISEVLVGAFSPGDPLYRFSGHLHPNGQGQLCGVLLVTSIASLLSNRRFKPLYLFTTTFAFIFLLLTKSLTSMVGFLIAITGFTFLRFSTGKRIRFAYLGVMMLLIILLLFSGGGFALDPIASATGRSTQSMATLTGRLPLWEICLEHVRERPIAGLGYVGFWTADRNEEIRSLFYWTAGTAHSAYIDIWLQLGIVGLVLHTTVMLLVLRRASVLHGATRKPEYAAAAGLSVQYLVYGALESTSLIKFSAILFPSYLLFLMVALSSGSQFRRTRGGGGPGGSSLGR
jgi:O-antigen ligase